MREQQRVTIERQSDPNAILIERLRQNQRARAMSRPEPSPEPARRFTSADVDMERVRAAMAKVGDQRRAAELTAERRRPRRYGPHDPGMAPTTVKVYLGGVTYQSGRQQTGHWPVLADVPVPEALLRQREAINRLAYEQGRR